MDDPRRATIKIRGLALAALAFFCGVGVFLAALHLIGRSTRAVVQDSDRYHVDFAAITCDPPPPIPADAFLSQVEYLSETAEQINVLDADLAARLAAAFALHPWVENVDRVEIKPSRRIEVRLRYREPVLAVRVNGQLRVVDRHGVLLPSSARAQGLPVYQGQASPPAGKAGSRWGDPAVEAAAGRASATLRRNEKR